MHRAGAKLTFRVLNNSEMKKKGETREIQERRYERGCLVVGGSWTPPPPSLKDEQPRCPQFSSMSSLSDESVNERRKLCSRSFVVEVASCKASA